MMKINDEVLVKFTKDSKLTIYASDDPRYNEGLEALYEKGEIIRLKIIKVTEGGKTVIGRFQDEGQWHSPGDVTFLFPQEFEENKKNPRRRQYFKSYL